MACNSKTTGRRAKSSNIWDSGRVLTHISGAYDVGSVQGHLGAIQCICLKMDYNSKMDGRRVKRTNLRLEDTSNTYGIHLTL